MSEQTPEEYDPKHLDPMPPPPEEVGVPITEQSPPALVFSDTTYEWLRSLVEVILPGAGAFYLTVSAIWNLPGGEKVSATLGALAVLVGLVVRLARRSYNKSDAKYDGVMNLEDRADGGQMMNLDLNTHPAALAEKKDITFKVVQQ
jgi:hypothetical protein